MRLPDGSVMSNGVHFIPGRAPAELPSRRVFNGWEVRMPSGDLVLWVQNASMHSNWRTRPTGRWDLIQVGGVVAGAGSGAAGEVA